MCGIALNLYCTALINRNQDSAGVRAVMRAGGMDDVFHDKLIIRSPEARSCTTNDMRRTTIYLISITSFSFALLISSIFLISSSVSF